MADATQTAGPDPSTLDADQANSSARLTRCPDDPSTLDADQTLDALIRNRVSLANLKAFDEALLDRLDQLAEAGEIDRGGFSHNDWTIGWSEGRRAWSYPPEVQALEQQLEAARKAAVASGTATAATGAPFWSIRAPRP